MCEVVVVHPNVGHAHSIHNSKRYPRGSGRVGFEERAREDDAREGDGRADPNTRTCQKQEHKDHSNHEQECLHTTECRPSDGVIAHTQHSTPHPSTSRKRTWIAQCFVRLRNINKHRLRLLLVLRWMLICTINIPNTQSQIHNSQMTSFIPPSSMDPTFAYQDAIAGQAFCRPS